MEKYFYKLLNPKPFNLSFVIPCSIFKKSFLRTPRASVKGKNDSVMQPVFVPFVMFVVK